MSIDESLIQKIQVQADSVFAEMKVRIKSLRDRPELLDNTLNTLWYEFYDEFYLFEQKKFTRKDTQTVYSSYLKNIFYLCVRPIYLKQRMRIQSKVWPKTTFLEPIPRQLCSTESHLRKDKNIIILL